MRILAIISGAYGKRHVENIRAHAPTDWTIESWRAPAVLPPIVDYPEDYLPSELPPADLLLAFGEHPGVAELLPDIAKMTGARAVIASIDNEAWLPRGLARQLRDWLADISVVCVTPRPLCTLTATHYNVIRRPRVAYHDPLIATFAQYFGKPELKITVDPQSRVITAVEVARDAVCGCARHVAEGLLGTVADDAAEKAGLLHHHYPCMASMSIAADYNDTLMHVSGNILKDNVAEQVKPFTRVRYFTPGTKSGE